MPIALAALILARPTKTLLFCLPTIDCRPFFTDNRTDFYSKISLTLARDGPVALQRRPSK